MIDLLETAKQVKRGVRLLDKLVPNWRRTMRKHAEDFNIESTKCCVLGTLEHYNGRMKVLRARRALETEDPGFYRGVARLNVEGAAAEYGFDATTRVDPENLSRQVNNYRELQALWRAEFEK